MFSSKNTLIGFILMIIAIVLAVPAGIIPGMNEIKLQIIPITMVIFIVAFVFFFMGYLDLKRKPPIPELGGISAVYDEAEPCPHCAGPLGNQPLLCDKCGEDFCGKKCLLTHPCFGDFDKHKVKE